MRVSFHKYGVTYRRRSTFVMHTVNTSGPFVTRFIRELNAARSEIKLLGLRTTSVRLSSELSTVL